MVGISPQLHLDDVVLRLLNLFHRRNEFGAAPFFTLLMYSNFRVAVLLAAGLVSALPVAGVPSQNVGYNPVAKIIQGDQPLTESYALSITAPSTMVAGSQVTVTLGFTVLSRATGVSVDTALGFITASPAQLTFTAPSQTLNTTITIAVPAGTFAGDYQWGIKPLSWPAGLPVTDAGATVNATAFPPVVVNNSVPAISLSAPVDGASFTYVAVTGAPISFPIRFSATVAAGGSPIRALQATFADVPLVVTSTGLGTLAATGTATSPNITTPGIYTVRVSATNIPGTSFATADVKVVVSAPPPTLTILSPTTGASYPLLGGLARVPISLSSTSIYGNITSLTAWLGNGGVSPMQIGAVGALTASGTSNFYLTAPGTYTLTAEAKTDYGTTTKQMTFTVAAVNATPVVSLATPAIIQRFAGDPPTAVNYTFQGTSPVAGTTIRFVSLALVSGVVSTPVIPTTLTGLNTAIVSGGGTLLISTPGTYTLSVTAENRYAVATAASTFTVRESVRTFCGDVTWLPPISLNKTIKGGSNMPIKFTLICADGGLHFVRDTSVLISIYDESDPLSRPAIYPFGAGSPNPPNYAINGNHYQLNFPTAKGTHRYRIEILGPSGEVLATKELNTADK